MSQFVLGMIVVSIIAQIPFFHDVFLWDRVAIDSGQWWRIVTGNLTHTNIIHMVMNLSALVILSFLHKSYYHSGTFIVLVWVMMPIIGIAMLFSPFSTYAGLSGVLHGLFAWGIVKDVQFHVPLSRMLLVGFICKMGYEFYAGGDGMTSTLIDASVAYQAHWVGALVGFAFAIFPCVSSRRINKVC